MMMMLMMMMMMMMIMVRIEEDEEVVMTIRTTLIREGVKKILWFLALQVL